MPSLIEGKFRLVISEIMNDPTGEEHILSRNAWVNCIREDKLASLDVIPELIAEINKKVQWTIERAKAANQTIDNLLQEIGNVAGEGGKR